MAALQLDTEIQPGTSAPDFTLNTPNGDTISLEDLRAKRTLLIFQRHLG